ncbi:26S proteasome non-ATPase regulatory subunit 12 [Coniophora puteana RWD-64-598 SS2]|uniref:26S proteasome non-ATPase regulatory subunit 12 n=1 Tax=Coniophora puteana (strain RWD-64-598) TaxID=741705 RepID=A0A5M3N6F7_CONPW|nr:26S proteasome non-ATPase regulatory subunit 12 [Coniophora puteana RWD-64-598 SS2]EIW86896.1 26S proteasome non-ATPase regulatory subunit 12 [Coniophora puteana RWD-64-598 SS2]
MADVKKQEKDFTSEVDSLLKEVDGLTKAGELSEALEKLLTLEKQTRNASDLASTTRLAKAALQHCYDARDYVQLNATLNLLSKKHGQLKVVIQELVEQAIGWLPEIKQRDGIEKWLELVETLRTITEGKIFLETPRARVTLELSHYHEGLTKDPKSTSPTSKESLQIASDLLSELQVETYSSMERREKTEFILEQMRLLIALARGEWVKARVNSRKVNEHFLKEKENEDLKLKFYELMIQQSLHQDAYLECAKHYEKVYETPSIKEDETGKGQTALEHIVYYLVLAPHTNEQSDMLHHWYRNPALAKREGHYNLVKSFVTRELMRWPGIQGLYGPFLKATPVFSIEKHWEDLHTRVIEHNIRVVSEYYTRITLTRLTDLLDLSAKQTEETLARLVVSGSIWARIDRPAGIINFRKRQDAEDVMNEWSSDMQRLLGLVEKAWMGVNAAQAAQSRAKAS